MVNDVLILTAPGQGAQTPGFLSPWLEIPSVAEQIGIWSELAGCDLVRLGTTGEADEITDTAVAQPLLVAAALAVAALLPRRPTRPPGTASASWPPAPSRESLIPATRSGSRRSAATRCARAAPPCRRA